ncbi:hypothetical protein ABZ547_40235 [Streptomyces sparsogenes]|uniref:hypothetical protein n=1 Tax=Streptomyces sparsogenes TaxID=67365 RepID=UPI0033F494D3
MRTRVRLTGVVMGAALLAGGAATAARAAPAPAETATGSCSPVISRPGGPVAQCQTLRDCEQTAENLGYEEWTCQRLPSGWWNLYVWP